MLLCVQTVPAFQCIVCAFGRVREIAKSMECSAWNNSTPSGRILIKSDISVLFEKSVEKTQASLNSNKHNGTSHADRYTFLIISR